MNYFSFLFSQDLRCLDDLPIFSPPTDSLTEYTVNNLINTDMPPNVPTIWDIKTPTSVQEVRPVPDTHLFQMPMLNLTNGFQLFLAFMPNIISVVRETTPVIDTPMNWTFITTLIVKHVMFVLALTFSFTLFCFSFSSSVEFKQVSRFKLVRWHQCYHKYTTHRRLSGNWMFLIMMIIIIKILLNNIYF